MFAIPYVIIFAFHPELDIDRVVIERSVGHLREKLTSLDYLTCEQLEFKDRATLLQLKKMHFSEIFSTELKFAANCLLKWFNKKFKLNTLSLSNDAKRV